MQVTIELEGTKATLESGDIQASDCLDLCIKGLIAVGFQAGSIRDAVNTLYEDLNEGVEA